ncbi:two component, sigma54 specific, transcriptional regulator, Fis family [Melioribacter roseus P3M-2]|uniref:Two component, sigma54 specific, transcriptional regulator, Fis family n=1 Tax=Melioribacter roseus (strain DSM 23840 / JCM 17771 / VKM B-2668 / P3M-2) TaxID=1191523 RepID=I6YY31_MELRP|nr:sigma-54 dependent transcriptional regulator [Melioribacter roseus]AFN75442.1 two component, sigma54 specific, transcriptional regulator, Fis family [Melioribacter roseus P3M-2]
MGIADYPELPILLVDDEEQFLFSVETSLNTSGINNIVLQSDSTKVLEMLEKDEYSLIVLDINMPGITGLELLPKIKDRFPEIPVIILTALNDVESAVESIKSGAYNYIVKPVDTTRLVTTIKGALEFREVLSENRRLKDYLLKDKIENPEAFEEIITKNKSMRSIFKYIEAIANSPLPVLITGETGVGKELIAGAIHKVSSRNGELVAVNVAGLDDTLFSDTLFGHKKGAFTGAEQDRKGLIEQAEKGTLFLDEIGDLSIESQVKLLRLIQDGRYYPLGSDIPKQADVRIICATNLKIEDMKESPKFRKDLYYRLQTHHIHIPPLRERKDDIPLLIDHFLEKAAEKLNKKKPTPPKELYTLLSNYNFPGNIRELEGLIYDAVSIHRFGVLSLDSIRNKIFPDMKKDVSFEHTEEHADKIIFPENLPTLKEVEEALISEALKRADNNQTIAARLLGLSRRALNNRINRKK